MARYLTPEWVDDVAALVASSPSVAKSADGVEVGVTQVVNGNAGEQFVYHLAAAPSGVQFALGPAEPEHVRFTQSRKTAVAVATGELAAQEAFVTGKIRMTGDHQKLIAAQPLFAAMEAVFDSVRQRTDYA